MGPGDWAALGKVVLEDGVMVVQAWGSEFIFHVTLGVTPRVCNAKPTMRWEMDAEGFAEAGRPASLGCALKNKTHLR